jgi:hypothetical protein
MAGSARGWRAIAIVTMMTTMTMTMTRPSSSCCTFRCIRPGQVDDDNADNNDNDTDNDIGRRRRGGSTHLAHATDISARTVDGVVLGRRRKDIRSVVDVARGGKVGTADRQNYTRGRSLCLRLCNAVIFADDKQTQSFLSMPICKEGSRWAKRVLLPLIDFHLDDDDDGPRP